MEGEIMPATSLLIASSLAVAEDRLHGQPQPHDCDNYFGEWQAEAAEQATPSAHIAEHDAAATHDVLIMQEVHHRIRNSLQMVQSLLNMQARQTTSATVARQLGDSAARVKVVGEMHNRLYRTEESRDVDIAPYLTQLVDDLRTSLIIPLNNREIVLNTDPGSWPAAATLSLGLVLTELVTNALRYGFGTVRIHFTEEGEHGGLLIVEDEGNLAAGFDLTTGSGFGMRLIKTLLVQRGGSLTIDRTAGHTRFIAYLPPASSSKKQGV